MFIMAMIFGIAQVLLTEQLIKNAGEIKKIFLFSLLKILLYGIAVGLLVLKFIWQFGVAISGFVAGVPIAAIALFVYKTIYKKQ